MSGRRLLRLAVLSWAGVLLVSAAPYEPRPDYAAAISSLQTLPSQGDNTPDSSTWRRRELERFRRRDIARQILSYLKLPCLPQPPAISVNSRRLLSRLTGLVQNKTSPGHRDRLQRAQSLPPSCNGPMSEASNELGPSVPSLRVFFNLTTFLPTLLEHATIEAAELRIFKKTGVPAAALAGESQPPQLLTVEVAMDVQTEPTYTGGSTAPAWPVSSQTVPVGLSEWLRVDVRDAVLAWQAGAANRGLLVTLKDADGHQLDPRLHLQELACDGGSEFVPDSPMPGFLVEAAELQHVALLSPARYPLLDLQTSEPAGDALPPGTGGQLPTPLPCSRPSPRPARAPASAAPPANGIQHTAGYRAFVARASDAGRGRPRRRPRPQRRRRSRL